MALLQADLSIFGTQTCYLAYVVDSLWRPGGPWGDPGTLGRTSKGTLRSRLGFLLLFDRFRDPILKDFWVPWTKNVYHVMLVSRLLFLIVFGFESGVEDWKST